MKCIKCGYETNVQFSRCPSCGTVQPAGQTFTTATAPRNVPRKRTGGEKASIAIAIVVSVLSVIAAFIIFIAYMTITVKNLSDNYEYGTDAFDDFDSNEYDDDFEEFFKDFYNNNDNENYGLKSPAGLNTPITFKEKLYSFSEGEIETEYEVSVTNTYRGDAALKLLEGAALPKYDEDENEIYLVKFKVKITDQEKDAIVTLPMSSPAAYPSDTDSLFSDDYDVISNLDYVNKFALISKGETVETWLAFIVDKEDRNPCILWNSLENKAFRDTNDAISDKDSVEAGAAIQKSDAAENETSSDVASSD